MEKRNWQFGAKGHILYPVWQKVAVFIESHWKLELRAQVFQLSDIILDQAYFVTWAIH